MGDPNDVQGWKTSVTDLVMFATGASEAMVRRLVRGSIRDCFVIADTKSALTAPVEVTARRRGQHALGAPCRIAVKPE